MHKFIDEAVIRVKAGHGGAGCVSFRHEKFIEKGGPDGGDGGDGGNIYIVADNRVMTLSHLRTNKTYKAANGRPGQGRLKSGGKGRDLTIKVPPGTQLIDPVSGMIINDFIAEDEPFLAAAGGRGGKGNAHFKSSVRQAPRFSQPGEDTTLLEFRLSLKMIADVGLVGFPNAGKSTLLKTLAGANPKIGAYPFTTLTPNLGVIEDEELEKLVIADIPGILEGASKGHGLGLSFLKHIERVRLLVYVLDLQTAHGPDELQILRNELETYNPEMPEKPYLVVFNKIDTIEDRDFLNEYLKSFKSEGISAIPVSAATGEGLEELKQKIISLYKNHLNRSSA